MMFDEKADVLNRNHVMVHVHDDSLWAIGLLTMLQQRYLCIRDLKIISSWQQQCRVK